MVSVAWLTEIQHWINKTLNVTDAQSAPIIATLLVFITGGIVKTVVSYFKNASYRWQIRKQFYLLLNNQADACDKQSDEYTKTGQSFNLEGLWPFHVGVVDFYQPGLIKELGYTEVYRAIFTGIENWFFWRLFGRQRKVLAFNTCWRVVDGVPSWQEKAVTDVKVVRDYYNSHNEKRMAQLRIFEQAHYSATLSIFGEPQADYARNYLNEINKIKDKVNKMENGTTPLATNEYMVKPILSLSESNTWPEAQKIRFNLEDALLTYLNMEAMLRNYTSQFNKYTTQFKGYSEEAKTGLIEIQAFIPRRRQKASKKNR
jgi:hypothetical protein